MCSISVSLKIYYARVVQSKIVQNVYKIASQILELLFSSWLETYLVFIKITVF